jgi:hypothetical protein
VGELGPISTKLLGLIKVSSDTFFEVDLVDEGAYSWLAWSVCLREHLNEFTCKMIEL